MYEELKALSKSDMYPFHMPGHKRRMPGSEVFDPYGIDITEIDGFDDMHDPRGLIKDLNKRLCSRFGGEEALILVNGSTAGVLAAISSTVSHGGKILIARNSHKSAYNAIELRGLKSCFIYPELIEEYCLSGGIDPDKVEAALKEDNEIEAVFITSPTYEGVVSDIAEISKICHSRGIPLIVDSAHGAHAGLYEPFTSEYGLRDAAADGADIVIESLHKTLPCFTQTAMVILNSGYIDLNRFRKYYSVYQTSSPSYIFMAGADKMLTLLDNEGEERFRLLYSRLQKFRDCLRDCKKIRCIGPEFTGSYGVKGFDPTKILLTAEGITGSDLYSILMEKYHLQPEMAAGDYLLLMTSIMDNEDGFRRLTEAVEDLIRNGFPGRDDISGRPSDRAVMVNIAGDGIVDIRNAEGKKSDSFIYAYPPGIPIIAPGEIFTKDIVEDIRHRIQKGLALKGLAEE
ncbi:MAG: aminotransferase class I/II-fold pyridoxal phosphate-dependent enzyme [Lachnospiraceae bacterium]|nr:aminotransferase class I/II-fold pyridoxal phosphate-dependent enzyme [Lachnospiraceae bacterium]